MNDEEYKYTQNTLVLCAGIIIGLDLDGMLAMINRAETIAPIIDPTLYVKAGRKMRQVERLVEAALVFQAEAKRQQTEVES